MPASQKAFVNIIMRMLGFHSSLLFILRPFPLPPSLDCRLPSLTAALQSAAREELGYLWEGKYLSFLRLQQGEQEAGQPTALSAGRRGGRTDCVI